MRPELEHYKILYIHQTYFVMSPFDLYASPCMKIVGWGFRKLDEAKEYMNQLWKNNYQEYERLKAMGRSFPDND